jgi:hypothetical protein
MERNFNVPGYLLRLAVFSSLHISDAGFGASLLKRLADIITAVGGETRKRAMLYFCVLCATDGEFINIFKVR